MRNAHLRGGIAVAAAASLVLAGCGSSSDSASPEETGTDGASFDAGSFFRGKTLRLVITHDVGGTTDVVARFIGLHLPDFIPGKPNVEVTNVPDIAGVNRVFTAPADRLIIGATSTAQGLYTSADEAGAEHDPEQIQVIGATEPAARGIILSSNTGYNDIRDAEKSTDPVLRYAGSVGGAEDITEVEMLMPWLCDHMELPCEFIQVADDDSATINLMQERGEVNVQAGGLSSRFRNLGEGFSDGVFRLGAVWEVGDAPLELPANTEMPPELSEMVPADDADAFDELLPMITTGGVGVPLWSGPAFDADVLASLQGAMTELLEDDALNAELAKLQAAPVIPISGTVAQERLHEATQTYVANKSVYSELQQRYWDQYWKG